VQSVTIIAAPPPLPRIILRPAASRPWLRQAGWAAGLCPADGTHDHSGRGDCLLAQVW